MQDHSRIPLIFGILACMLLLIFCWGVITSMDLMRHELEDVKKTLKDVQETLVSLPSSGLARTAEAPAVSGNAANAQYFDPEADQGGRLIFAIQADSGNLNGIVMCDATVSEFWSNAMDPLAEPDYADPDKYKGMLAESWSVSEDNLVWHIKLRKGILWHDFTDPVTKKEWKNVEVTAHDFKFYLDVIKDENVDAVPLRTYMSAIREIRVINDLEFEVIWDKPYFKSKDITLGLTPLPRHFYNADGKFDGKKFNDDTERNKMIVGCGPYQFLRWENGRRVLFKRFEKYYGRQLGIMPPLRQISYDVIKHGGTRLQALKSQEIDYLGLQPNQWMENTNGPEFGKDGFLDKVRYPNFGYSFIGLNYRNPLFQDRRIRQGLSMLIDRNRILRDVYSHLARPVSGPFFADSPAYDKSIQPYEFSIENAKKQFAGAGWRDSDGDGILDKDGKPFRFTVLYPNISMTSQKVLSILREDMAKAGVQMEVLALEWPVVEERLDSRNFDACLIGWTGSMRPDPFQLWHSSTADQKSSSNFISFRNPEADRLIEAIRVEFDDAKRQELYHKFHKLLHEESPYLFLFSPDNLLGINRRYRNKRQFPQGVPTRLLWTPRQQQMQIPGF